MNNKHDDRLSHIEAKERIVIIEEKIQPDEDVSTRSVLVLSEKYVSFSYQSKWPDGGRLEWRYDPDGGASLSAQDLEKVLPILAEWLKAKAPTVETASELREDTATMTNKHDDRLNKLERWLETYGDKKGIILRVRLALDDAGEATAISLLSRALRELANIVGVGLEDL